MSHSYPFHGQLYPSSAKKFAELVFFVSFYEGNKRILSKHIQLVNSLGFDAFAFNFKGRLEDIQNPLKWPISPNGKFGLKHLYADQIEVGLNLFSQKKIIYSFSNPAASAIEAMARRRCTDVVALICDSGPTGGSFIKSAFNLIRDRKILNFLPLQMLASGVYGLSWSFEFHQDISGDLASFPEGFPILSIRGWKDQLISPEDIDLVFDQHKNLNWQKLNLPEAGHLNGLRDFPGDYTPPLEKFLKAVAKPV